MKHACKLQTSITPQYKGKCRVITGRVCQVNQDCKESGKVCDGGQCKCGTCSHVNESPVCGSDGNSYKSSCDLERRLCLENRNDILVAHEGICKTCEPVYWGGIPTNNRRYCEKDCTSCPTEYEPVCSIEQITYKNKCFADCDDARVEAAHSCYDKFRQFYEQTCHGDCRYKECSFIDGQQVCSCMMCPLASPDEVVCGADGQSYPSACILHRTNCELGLEVTISHAGSCKEVTPTAQKCDSCNFGGVCIQGACDCNFYCSSVDAPICGSDGQMYKNECYLRQQSCKSQQLLTISEDGTCTECSSGDLKYCPIYSTECSDGKCQCPTCPTNIIYEQTCGSDGQYYRSRCHLREKACRERLMLFEVPCNDYSSASYDRSDYESSGDFSCIYGAVASFDDDDCHCDWHCPSETHGLRDESGQDYQNLCYLYRDGKCSQQRDVTAQPICDSQCNAPNVLDHTTCDIDGSCLCAPHHVGRTCQECPAAYFKLNGRCEFCNCDPIGSDNAQCNSSGQCTCLAGFQGQNCNEKVSIDIESCAGCYESDRLSGQVCASDHRFYSSICTMKEVNCLEPPLGSVPHQVRNDFCNYSQEPMSASTPSPQITIPTTTSTTTTTTTLPSTTTYTMNIFEPEIEEIDFSGDGSGDWDDEDFMEPDLRLTSNYFPGKIEPETYVEVNRAEYRVKIHLSDSGLRQGGEEFDIEQRLILAEETKDRVKSILKSMIPDINMVSRRKLYNKYLAIIDRYHSSSVQWRPNNS